MEIKNQKFIYKFLFFFTCLIFVISVCGYALIEIYAGAENQTVKDVKISIDFAPYEEEFPDGVVGKNYNIFPATAVDNLGNTLMVDVVVTDPDNKVVLVNNGKFKTDKLGEYTIMYKSSSGVVEDVEMVKVNVVSACTPLTYKISSKVLDCGITGELFYLYDGVVEGGSGAITVNMNVQLDGNEIEVINTGDVQYFKPLVGGEYLIKYTLSDFVDNVVVVDKVVNIEDSLKPILTMPSIALLNKLGDEVKLPMIDAVLYKDGYGYYVPVKVSYDGEDITNTMTYTADTVGEHVIRYFAENVFTGDIAEKIFTINVVDPNSSEIYVSNYFATTNLNGSFPSDASGYLLTAINDGDAGFQFTSKIYQEFVSIDFALEGINKSLPLSELQFTLTDSERGEDKVTIALLEQEEMTKVYNNGKLTFQSEITLNNLLSSGFGFKYDYLNNTIMDSANNVLYKITSFDDGRVFNGFMSKHIFISLKMLEMKAGTSFSIKTIATDPMSGEKYDLGKPKFYTTDTFTQSLSADVGETVTLVCPKAFDLLDNDNVTYSAKIVYETIKDGEQIKDTIFNGTMEGQYNLLIEGEGKYKVEFYAMDSSGLRNRLIMTIHVADRISPSVSVDFKTVTVKVGDEIDIPKATFTDNISLNEDCKSFVYVSYGAFLKDLVNDKYKFTQKGEYIFTYSVWDAVGNCTTIKYVVTCK